MSCHEIIPPNLAVPRTAGILHRYFCPKIDDNGVLRRPKVSTTFTFSHNMRYTNGTSVNIAWVKSPDDDPIYRAAWGHGQINSNLHAHRSHNVDNRDSVDRPAICRHLMATEDAEMLVQRMTNTAKSIRESYGRHIAPVG